MSRLRAAIGRPLPPRVGIVQRELDRFSRARYLEIGVHTGVVFLHVRAYRKLGVDPAPAVPRWKRLTHPNTLLRGRILAATSDAFFASLGREERFDVVFVDGDHHREQAVRDVENGLAHLSAEGVVLIHDCDPPSPGAASRDSADAAGGPWCGDVWKAIVELRATRHDLVVETLATDCGIGVVRRGTATASLGLTPAEIATMSYADLEAGRADLLGLRAA